MGKYESIMHNEPIAPPGSAGHSRSTTPTSTPRGHGEEDTGSATAPKVKGNAPTVPVSPILQSASRAAKRESAVTNLKLPTNSGESRRGKSDRSPGRGASPPRPKLSAKISDKAPQPKMR